MKGKERKRGLYLYRPPTAATSIVTSLTAEPNAATARKGRPSKLPPSRTLIVPHQNATDAGEKATVTEEEGFKQEKEEGELNCRTYKISDLRRFNVEC